MFNFKASDNRKSGFELISDKVAKKATDNDILSKFKLIIENKTFLITS